jgi:small subunit ribosomal protein S28e
MEIEKLEKIEKARVVERLGRTGSRGGITQVRVQLIGNEHKERQLIRNVKGPVRVGDCLELMECEREARRIR